MEAPRIPRLLFEHLSLLITPVPNTLIYLLYSSEEGLALRQRTLCVLSLR